MWCKYCSDCATRGRQKLTLNLKYLAALFDRSAVACCFEPLCMHRLVVRTVHTSAMLSFYRASAYASPALAAIRISVCPSIRLSQAGTE